MQPHGEFKRPDKAVSKFTILIYLNDWVDGGGTTFTDVFRLTFLPTSQ